MVYKTDTNGNRYNNITKKNYIKQNCNGLIKIPTYKRVFKPRECFNKRLKEIPMIWQKYVEGLQKVGIDDIGIFGSFLIGFDVTKDVDFVIYGLDNFKKYYKNIEYIKEYINATSITKEHIEKQYNKHKKIYSEKCSLKKIIERNWSGVELDNGVLSTPRFIVDNYITPEKQGIDDISGSQTSCIHKVIFGAMGQHFNLPAFGQVCDRGETAVRAPAQSGIIAGNPGTVGRTFCKVLCLDISFESIGEGHIRPAIACALDGGRIILTITAEHLGVFTGQETYLQRGRIHPKPGGGGRNAGWNQHNEHEQERN